MSQRLTEDEVEQIRRTMSVNDEVEAALYASEKNVPIWSKIKILLLNKCFVYLCIAGFFRFMGGYALGFFVGSFFDGVFPDDTTISSIGLTIIPIFGGIPASILAGILADKYEDRIPRIKGYIAGYGALAACPFMAISYFW